MKKSLALLAPVVAFLSFVPSAFAKTETLCSETGKFSALCNPSIDKLIVGLINLIFVLSVVVALLYLIWGGFKWLTSGGDKTAVQGAREHIVAAIVGLVIIFMSYFILNFIVQFFIPNFNLNNFRLPSITNPSGEDSARSACISNGQACGSRSINNGRACCSGTCSRPNNVGVCRSQ